MTYQPSSEAEGAFLADYDPTAYPTVALTADVVLLTIRDGQLSVLLVERAEHPYRGAWALPGGFVGPDEDADTAAARELEEETGLEAASDGTGRVHLEQLATYTAPDRDPRTRVVSVAYMAVAADVADPVAGSDAAAARFWPVADLAVGLTGNEDPEAGVDLAFDHERIIADAVARLRGKLEYTTLATLLVAEPFTIPDLRRAYETVWDEQLEPVGFRQRMVREAAVDRIRAIGDTEAGGRPGRPAALYRRGGHFFLDRTFPAPGAGR